MRERADRRRAARTAYRTLLAASEGRLPIDVKAIIKKLNNVQIMSYTQAALALGDSFSRLTQGMPSDSACTLVEEGPAGIRYLVLYNDDAGYGNEGRRRWSLAHELGHILLKHEEDSSGAEIEADCFARHLLCPQPLLERLDALDEDVLCVAFGLSRSAARSALRGMEAARILVDEDMRAGLMDLFRPDEGLLRPGQKVACALRRRRKGATRTVREPSL